MKVGFLIIGSEVLDGKISDLNTKILADFLNNLHLDINEAVVARDTKASIENALNHIFSNNDVVITSGGLGPTKDDITKETLSAFLKRKINFSEDSFNIAKENYQRLGRPFPGKDHGYCYLPEGFIPLSNSTGFAPGLYTHHEQKILFSAPGVPREFLSMLKDHFINAVSHLIDKGLHQGRVIVRTKKVPEEKIFNEVDSELWGKLEKFGEVSSLPILMGVDIGVKLKALSAEELSRKISAVNEIFNESPIKEYIWNFGQESIEEKIVSMANRKKIKFGFAESATGGLCSHRITNISGSSNSFIGSVVCYDEQIKEQVLGVNKETLATYSAVSLECAKEMAQGLRHKFNLDIAISITGYAGPGGGDEKFPVGSVCIGKSTSRGQTSAECFHLKGDREVLKQRFSQAALFMLLEELESFA